MRFEVLILVIKNISFALKVETVGFSEILITGLNYTASHPGSLYTSCYLLKNYIKLILSLQHNVSVKNQLRFTGIEWLWKKTLKYFLPNINLIIIGSDWLRPYVAVSLVLGESPSHSYDTKYSARNHSISPGPAMREEKALKVYYQTSRTLSKIKCTCEQDILQSSREDFAGL